MTELKRKSVNRLVTVSLLVLMVVMGRPAFSDPQAGRASEDMPITDDGLQILGLGRQVYGDLQLARQAALNRQADQLRTALRRVRENLDRLNLPPALVALKAQAAIVTNNLADMTEPVDADLWVPIDAELEAVSLYLPAQTRAQARAAVRAGRIAAAKGERTAARTQLDLLVSFLQLETGAFPLQRVRADIQSAWSSASLPQPYWKGALEAVQSALGEIHWVTGVNARQLLSAYRDAVNAYVLWPEHKQAAIDNLIKAQKALSMLSDGAALAADADRLIKKSNLGLMGKNDLGDDDLKQFVADIGRRIDSERAAARENLLERLSDTKTG